MSFPGSFPSQLTAIMEALLKAVVAEVTALVEDGAVELRLELRDRDRQILDKEREVEERDREIEERDRVIEELRDAVEELMARGDAAMSPAEEEKDGPEQNESSEQEQEQEQEWSKDDDYDDDDTKPIVKSEPTQEFAAASPDPHVSLWPPPPPLCSANEDAAAACSYDETHTYNSHEATEEFSADLPLDSLLDMGQEHFYSAQQQQQQQHGFSLVPNSSRATKQKGMNAKQRKLAAFRCDQCGKAFTEKRRLVTHQSVHTGAKPYSCRKCGKKFSRRDNCVRHEKSDARCRDSPVKFNERKGLMQELNLASALPNCSHFN